jgi:hypothetical protein
VNREDTFDPNAINMLRLVALRQQHQLDVQWPPKGRARWKLVQPASERAVAVPAGKVAETTDKPDDGPGRSRAE